MEISREAQGCRHAFVQMAADKVACRDVAGDEHATPHSRLAGCARDQSLQARTLPCRVARMSWQYCGAWRAYLLRHPVVAAGEQAVVAHRVTRVIKGTSAHRLRRSMTFRCQREKSFPGPFQHSAQTPHRVRQNTIVRRSTAYIEASRNTSRRRGAHSDRCCRACFRWLPP